MAKGEVKVRVGMDNAKFRKGMKNMTANVKKFARMAKSAFKGIAIGVGAIAAALAAVALATRKALSMFAEWGDVVGKMAKRTGFSVKSLQELRYMMELSGSSIEGLEKSVRRMQMAIFDAGLGLKTYTDLFDVLRIDVKSIEGLHPEKQFEIITTRLADLKDSTLRAAIAQKLFGRAGTSLLPMLQAGSQGMARMKSEADRLGLIFTPKQVAMAEALKDAFTRLSWAFKVLVMRTVVKLAPKAIEWFNKLAYKIGEFVKSAKFKKFQEGFKQAAEFAVLALQAMVKAVGILLGGGTDKEKKKLETAMKAFGAVVKDLFVIAANEAVKILIGAAKLIGHLIAEGFKGLVTTSPERRRAEERARQTVSEKFTLTGTGDREKVSFSEFKQKRKEYTEKYLREELAKSGKVLAEVYGQGGDKLKSDINALGDALKDLAGLTKEEVKQLEKKLQNIITGGGGGGFGEDTPEVERAKGGRMGGGVFSDALRRIGGYSGAGGAVANQIPQRQLTQLEAMRKSMDMIVPLIKARIGGFPSAGGSITF